MRSGIQILADHPRFYFNDGCTPGSDWIRFTRRKIPTDRFYTAMDDAVTPSSWIALPGGLHALGVGRQWHFFTLLLWGLNGLIYIIALFATGQWRRLIPTSWVIFPQAWDSFVNYLYLKLPPDWAFHPYDPLQQLTYAAVVFILAPLIILSGFAMAPAIIARFPWYIKLFGGRQSARSIHFILLVCFLAFTIVHISLVIITGFAKNMQHIALADSSKNLTLAVIIGLAGIAFVILVHVLVTWWSQRNPRSVQFSIGVMGEDIIHKILYPLTSKQKYKQEKISPYFWSNGYPPTTEPWTELAKNRFQDYRLEVNGLVSSTLQLSLADLKMLPKSTQITLHNCIQGWTGIGEWSGVELSVIIKHCRPLNTARYVIFYSFQKDKEGREYYSILDIKEALRPQTILAYEMNGSALNVEHGAPVRVRIETKLGFKMVKWLRAVSFADDYKNIEAGHGGYKEDFEYFRPGAQM